MDLIGKLCQELRITCLSSCCNGGDSQESSSIACQTEQPRWSRVTMEGSEEAVTRDKPGASEDISPESIRVHKTEQTHSA